jgi:hypothetical protein
MKTALLVVMCTVLLLAAGGTALHLWLELGDVKLGAHGWLALGLGVGLSLLLGVGLMTLVFHSARHGYDEAGGPPAAGPDGGDEGGENAKRREDEAQR